MPPVTPREEFQSIRDLWLTLNLEQDPSFVKRFYVGNVFQRVFAYLVGQGESMALPVEVTEDGRLKVVTLPGGFTHNDTTYVAAVPDAFTAFTFADICGRVDVWCWTKGVTIKRRPNAVSAYEDEIRIDANQFFSFDCDTEAIQYKNTAAGQTASLQLSGWY